MGSIITIATSKGGGGKTATAMCLAANLAALAYQVTVIDADRNASFHSWHSAIYEGPAFRCVPEIRHIEVVKAARLEAETAAVVIIDTAGFENLTAAMAIGTSDFVLIPTMPDRASVIEAIKTARQVTAMEEGARRPIPASIVLTRWNPRGLVERAAMADLTNAGLDVLEAYLPDLSDFGKASYSGDAPTGGRVGQRVDRLIAELVRKGAIPTIRVAAA